MLWYGREHVISTVTSSQFLEETSLHAFQFYNFQVAKPLTQKQCNSLWYPSDFKELLWYMEVLRGNLYWKPVEIKCLFICDFGNLPNSYYVKEEKIVSVHIVSWGRNFRNSHEKIIFICSSDWRNIPERFSSHFNVNLWDLKKILVWIYNIENSTKNEHSTLGATLVMPKVYIYIK